MCKPLHVGSLVIDTHSFIAGEATRMPEGATERGALFCPFMIMYRPTTKHYMCFLCFCLFYYIISLASVLLGLLLDFFSLSSMMMYC